MSIIMAILGWFSKGPLGWILDTVDKKFDNETERERIKAEAVSSYLAAQTAVLTGPGWWFPLLFIVPFGFWFAAVCLYSVFFCAGCMYPVGWTIAALPGPLNDWAGLIIGGLFVGAGVPGFVRGLRGK